MMIKKILFAILVVVGIFLWFAAETWFEVWKKDILLAILVVVGICLWIAAEI